MVRAGMMMLAGAAALAIAVPTAAAAQIKDAKTGEMSGTDAGTRDLNREAADAAAAQNAANDANAAQFHQSVADYEAERTAVSQARAAYEADLEANRQARAAYDAAYARWQADVAACTAGDFSRCQPGPAPK